MENPKTDKSEAENAEFQRVLENLVNTPPKPHNETPPRKVDKDSVIKG
jgi:hypothetical protein